MFWRRKEEPKPRDWRPLSTIGIWMLSVPLFGLSIPLGHITHSADVSILVLAATTISTAFVWAFGGRNWQDEKRERLGRQAAEQQNEQLRAQVEELTTQVEALETMRRYERRAGIFDEEPPTENFADSPDPFAPPTAVYTSASPPKTRARGRNYQQKIAS